MNDAPSFSLLPDLLLPWFEQEKRDLEWRRNPTPYRVWISEIMLQQTRVEAAKPYYERFLAALPDVRALAKAEESLLLKLWEGLGYYRRVRNLQAAAKTIMERHNGVFPSDPTAIRALPGIGDYTAGAIASIAFGLPTPAVDGNVLRVLSRFLASERDIDSISVRRDFSVRLAEVYPQGRCSEFTQSLMELGATVCLPSGEPRCDVCPLADHCLASKRGLTDRIPVRKSKTARRIETKTVLVIRREDRIALSRRGPSGLLAGMYEFPNVDGAPDATALAERFRLSDIRDAGRARHVFSHVEWHMLLRTAVASGETPAFRWATLEELEREIALPSAFRAASALAKSVLRDIV